MTRSLSRREVLSVALAAAVLFGLGLVTGILTTERPIQRGAIVLLCAPAGEPQCPPDTDRLVLATWSDGELRLSTYSRSEGWRGASPYTIALGHHVLRWQEIPAEMLAGGGKS